MLMTILIVLVVVALFGGAVGHPRFGAVGWSPAGVLLAIVLVLYFTGHLHG